jgi:hypothetical protein
MVNFPIAGGSYTVDRAPSSCPICHHAIDARYLLGLTLTAESMGALRLELIFQCPRAECLHAFIGRYEGQYERAVNAYRSTLRRVTPFAPQPAPHSKQIADLSTQFVAILDQASAAEAFGLTEVAGCGYRKALEFLVKDYCASIDPAAAPAIQAKLLGQVIVDHIKDPNIQECARRATWLGNDATHYVRRWTDKDIGDLKTLIALTESWINTHLLTEKYLREMPK